MTFTILCRWHIFIQLKNIPINMILCRSKQYGRPWWIIFVAVDPMNWFFWPEVVEWIHAQEHDRPILIFLENHLRNQGKIEVLPQILQEIYWLLHGSSLSDLGNPILSISPHFHFGCLTDTGGRVCLFRFDWHTVVQWWVSEFLPHWNGTPQLHHRNPVHPCQVPLSIQHLLRTPNLLNALHYHHRGERMAQRGS